MVRRIKFTLAFGYRDLLITYTNTTKIVFLLVRMKIVLVVLTFYKYKPMFKKSDQQELDLVPVQVAFETCWST